MKSLWNQTAPDQIEIRPQRSLLLILFGLPFLSIGLWFTYHIFGAACDVITHKAKLMDDIFAFTLLPILALLFLWPGVLLAVGRKTWIINNTSRTALATTSIVFAKWKRRYSLEDYRQVRAYRGQASTRSLTEEIEDEREGRYPARQPYCLDLIPKEPKLRARTVAASAQPEDMVELGKALAALIQLPFANDTGKSR